MGKHEKRTEFSKKIMIFAGIINVLVLTFACIMIWRTGDLTPLQVLVPAVAAEVSVGTNAYYSKAKVENRIKLMKKYGIEINEMSFSENL